MNAVEKDVKTVNLIISNLEDFSSKADRLLMGKTKGYPDFFDRYSEYLTYLRSLHFEKNEINQLIQNAPKIPAPGFSFIKLLFILPLFLYLYLIQIYLLIFIWIPIAGGIGFYFFINERKKHTMDEILIFNSRLLDLLADRIC
jgi:hypothetical protein